MPQQIEFGIYLSNGAEWNVEYAKRNKFSLSFRASQDWVRRAWIKGDDNTIYEVSDCTLSHYEAQLIGIGCPTVILWHRKRIQSGRILIAWITINETEWNMQSAKMVFSSV